MKSVGQSKATLLFLLKSLLFVITTMILISLAWQYTMKKQLAALTLKAENSVELYTNKVELELAKTQTSLLLILANTQVLEDFLKEDISENSEKKLKAQLFLNQLQQKMPNSAVFVGNNRQTIIASSDLVVDLTILKTSRETISRRAFSYKNTENFIFADEQRLAKYLIALPVLKNNNSLENQNINPENVLGFIGVIIDLSQLQKELSGSLSDQEEVVIVSDSRGIIMLSSKTKWLYQSFFKLPYTLKKSLDKNFVKKQLFSQLNVGNFTDNIVTISNNIIEGRSESYLVHSSGLNKHPLKIHHLSNISFATQFSYFIVVFILIFLIFIVFLLLFLKEKRQALLVQSLHEQTLKTIDVEFKQQQKLASMGMMATTIAHDINQPITAIKTEAKIGIKNLERGNLDESLVSFNTIVNYTQLLSKITTQLKDFARKRQTTMSNTTVIKSTLLLCLKLNQHRLEAENIHWQLCCEDEILAAKIDQFQFQQIINNLIQNACDAMEFSTDKHFKIEVMSDDTMINLFFSDKGKGINETLKTTLFMPFVSSKEDNHSMGLGLAICRDILTKVGGDICLTDTDKYSLKDKYLGARFKITLLKN